MLAGDGNCGYRAIGVSLVTVVAQLPRDHQVAFGRHIDGLYQRMQSGPRMGWRSSTSGGSVGHGYRILKVYHDAMIAMSDVAVQTAPSHTLCHSCVMNAMTDVVAAFCARSNMLSASAMSDALAFCARSNTLSAFTMSDVVREVCAKSGVQNKPKHIMMLCVGPLCLTATCNLSV